MNKQGPGKIDWTDFTWSPVTGCLRGCPYCYARRTYERFGMSFEPTLHDKRLAEPAKVKTPSKIFVCSVADLFGPWVPDEWIGAVLGAADDAPWHTYQYLTKYPENLSGWYWNDSDWVGATVTDEATTDAAITALAGVDAATMFLSAEPLLGPITLTDLDGLVIKWLIIGSMTGPGATPPKTEWVQGLIDSARAAGIPVWLKENLRWPETIQEWPKGGSMTWIPVGERLPREGTGSLVARRWFNIFNGKYEGEVLIAWLIDGLWRFSGSADVPPLDDVTHWQPLPPLPGADQ